jgi:fructose-1,6-bisphosphatase
MEIQPSKLHERSPLFVGSELDVNMLEYFIDAEKLNGKTILE